MVGRRKGEESRAGHQASSPRLTCPPSHLCLPLITNMFTPNSQHGLRLTIQPGNACVDKAMP